MQARDAANRQESPRETAERIVRDVDTYGDPRIYALAEDYLRLEDKIQRAIEMPSRDTAYVASPEARSVSFTVHGKAQPAGSKTAGVTKSGRTFVRDSARRSAPWKREVAQAAGEAMQGAPLLEGALRLGVVFAVPRPQGHYGARGLKPSAPEYPTVRPDVTKLLRAVEDALTGVVWRDDAQVVWQVAWKEYGEPAHCIVTVTQL